MGTQAPAPVDESSRYTVHPIQPESSGVAPLWCILPEPDDGTEGFIIGDYSALLHLSETILAALRGEHGEPVGALDERLGFVWLTVPEAAELSKTVDDPVSRESITRACRLKQINGAKRDSRGWVFPRMRFLSWLSSRKRIPGPQAKA